jgi:hypothetical protein
MSDWRSRAACLGRGDAFFPDPSDAERVAKAEAICRYCPALIECRAYSRELRPEAGVWAGKLRGKK